MQNSGLQQEVQLCYHKLFNLVSLCPGYGQYNNLYIQCYTRCNWCFIGVVICLSVLYVAATSMFTHSTVPAVSPSSQNQTLDMFQITIKTCFHLMCSHTFSLYLCLVRLLLSLHHQNLLSFALPQSGSLLSMSLAGRPWDLLRHLIEQT